MQKLEDDAAVDSMEKIKAPIVWYETSNFKILDLHDNQFNEALTLIERHYFTEEPMCKSIGLLKDLPSVKSYVDLIKCWMKGMCSLIAVSRKSGRIVGIAVSKINSLLEKSEIYSRVQKLDGETLKSIMHLQNALIRQSNIHENLGHNTYLQICIFVVHDSYKIKGVGNALLESCRSLASSIQVPLVLGIFTSNEDRMIAEKSEFTLLSEILYKNWIINKEVVFKDPGISNYSAVSMISHVQMEKFYNNCYNRN